MLREILKCLHSKCARAGGDLVHSPSAYYLALPRLSVPAKLSKYFLLFFENLYNGNFLCNPTFRHKQHPCKDFWQSLPSFNLQECLLVFILAAYTFILLSNAPTNPVLRVCIFCTEIIYLYTFVFHHAVQQNTNTTNNNANNTTGAKPSELWRVREQVGASEFAERMRKCDAARFSSSATASPTSSRRVRLCAFPVRKCVFARVCALLGVSIVFAWDCLWDKALACALPPFPHTHFF
jgi:hypothetical protein